MPQPPSPPPPFPPPFPAPLSERTREAYHHGNLREALIEAGLHLTRTGGADALVLRDVTRRVGVSPNAAYRHFADRDALRAAVRTRIHAGIAERMRSLEAKHPPGMSPARARLRAVGLGYVSFALDEPGWFDVAFASPDALPAEIDRAAPPAAFTALARALDGLVETGELAADDRAGAEWPCWSAVHGFALLALRGPLRELDREEVEAAAQRTVDAVIDGLLGG